MTAPRVVPLIFQPFSIQAMLDGRKTMTRRVLKPQPPTVEAVHELAGCGYQWIPPEPRIPRWRPVGPVWAVRELMGKEPELKVRFAVGELIWVRETWQIVDLGGGTHLCAYRANCEGDRFSYAGDGSVEIIQIRKWRPPIRMPRLASRITLKVTDVKVERLKEITEADCIAEGPVLSDLKGGFDNQPMVWPDPNKVWLTATPRAWYRELWDSINGAGSWDSNPWVVAITFEVIKENIDDVLRKEAA